MNKGVKRELDKRFKDKYEKLVGKDFDVLCDSLEPDLNRLDDIDSIDLFLKNLSANVQKTKYRWHQKALSEKGQVKKDVDFAKAQYEKVLNGELTISKFKSYFDAKNVNEYKTKLIDLLAEWKRDENNLLSDFKYFSKLTKKSLTSAFKNDITLTYIKYRSILDKDEAIMTKIPSILSDIPIDTTSRIDFLTDAQKRTLDLSDDITKPSTIDRYIMIGEEEQNELLFQLEQSTYIQIKSGGNSTKVQDLLTQIALIKSVKYLNRLDVKIISYYYTHFHKLVLGDAIEKSIYQITKDIGLANQPKNYEAVESSIAKLGSMTLSYNLEGNSINGIFLESSIYESNGARIAKVYLGTILKELILKKSTFEYDEVTFNILGADAQQLAIWLQKRRYKSAIKNEGYAETIYLSRFSTAIYWNTKRSDRRRDRIIAALEDLKANNLIISDFYYDRKSFGFELKYIPLSPRELAKLDAEELAKENLIEEQSYKLIT